MRMIKLLATASVVFALIVGGSAQATITTSGNVTGYGTPYNGTDNPWNTQYLVVGESAPGSMSITGGSAVYDSGDDGGVGYTTIGETAAASGSTVTVDGGGSTWAVQSLVVGYLGTGTLNISGGGTVSCFGCEVGRFSGGVGTINIGGETGSSRWTTGGVWVGESGTGILNIKNGGIVSTDSFVLLGSESSGSGTVNIGGAVGASWNIAGQLYVGYVGSGTLNINTGGLVSAAALNGGNATSAINFDGGTLRITATDSASNTIHLLSGGGTIDVPTASTTFTITSGVNGAGSLTKTGTATLALTGANSYTGNTTVAAGTFKLSGSASFANSPRISVASGATLDIAGVTGGANFSGGRFLLASGQTLQGFGNVVGPIGVGSGAILAPGNAVGTGGGLGVLSLSGNYAQSGSGNLQIEIGGTTAGSGGYDQLAISGGASVGGTLSIFGTSAGGVFFQPQVGQTFDVLTATGGVSGTFGTSLQWIIAGEIIHYTTIYSANKVTLQVTSIDPLNPGDTDGDNVVDFNDYVAFATSYGSNLAAADFDHSGTVDTADYVLFKKYYTAAAARASASQSPAHVPEPTSIALAFMGMLMLATRFRTR